MDNKSSEKKESVRLHQENDRRYQALFRNVELIQDLLIYCVKAPWVEQVDMDSITLHNTKSVTGQMARRDADIIYKLPFKDGTLSYLALFLEFQSQPDPFMALRISTYKHLFWEDLVAMGNLSPNRKLPPVFGLVLYNGSRQWRSPKQLRNLIELSKDSPLWSQQPQASYQLIDEKRINDYHEDSISHYLFQMEFCDDRARLIALVNRVSTLIQGTPGHQRLSEKIAKWFSAAMFDKLQLELPFDEAVNDLEGINHMLSDALQKWVEESKQEGLAQGLEEGLERGLEQGLEAGREQGLEQGRAQGLKRGIEQGVQQGIAQRSIEVAERMLAANLEDALILEMAEITTEQLQALKERFGEH